MADKKQTFETSLEELEQMLEAARRRRFGFEENSETFFEDGVKLSRSQGTSESSRTSSKV